jgi:hypothetical protein
LFEFEKKFARIAVSENRDELLDLVSFVVGECYFDVTIVFVSLLDLEDCFCVSARGSRKI